MIDKIIPRKPGYTTQRDNRDFSGNPEPSSQCFIEAMTYFWKWIWKSFLTVNYEIDDRAYLGIVLSKLKFGEKRTSWDPHVRILNEYFQAWELSFAVNYFKTLEVWDSVVEAILKGIPVVCQIDISKYLKGANGHIIMIVGIRLDDSGKVLGVYILDPYGNYKTKYKDHNGDTIFVPIEDLHNLIGEHSHCILFTTEVNVQPDSN